jgi:lysine decarboxylase/arginine decarboxylase
MHNAVSTSEMRVLMIDDDLSKPSATGCALRALVKEIRYRRILVVEAASAEEGRTAITAAPLPFCVLLAWTLSEADATHEEAKALIDLIKGKESRVPIFLMDKRGDAHSLTTDVMRDVDEVIWMLTDAPAFVAGRIVAAMRFIRKDVAPSLSRALVDFSVTRSRFSEDMLSPDRLR